MLQELKAFLFRGNVIDLAVAVLIAAAFGLIITSFVENIINPLVGMLFSADLSALVLTVNGVDFRYGAFLSTVINFLIVGTVLFLIVKVANQAMDARKAQVDVDEPAPEIPEDVALLREIRDALVTTAPASIPPPPPPA